MSSNSYRKQYNEYWTSDTRFGEDSYAGDLDGLVRNVLALCRFGKILDVGAGMGKLVRALLEAGCDAYGVDISDVAIKSCEAWAPGRFKQGNLLNLPFADNEFDTVVCTDVLEHLEEADVSGALAELRRVSKQHLFLTVSTHQDRDARWHLTVQPRDWWERAALDAGWRKHPLGALYFSHRAWRAASWRATMLFEKIPDQALAAYPLESLARERDLHMDMARESGGRSVAHIERYHVAAEYVRPGDRVLDAACGLGYGSHVLYAHGRASSLVGLDISQAGIEYATENYARVDGSVAFQVHDLAEALPFPDSSIDVVSSFETLEHIPDPELFLREAHRILAPGGRIVASIPNLWVDETGKDPNPYHLHVYDWDKLRAQLAKHFLVEAAYSQIAGGGMKLTHHAPQCVPVGIDAVPALEAEWWLMVAMKHPSDGTRVKYRDRAFPRSSRKPDVVAFERHYDNPWLAKSLVTIGWRVGHDPSLRALANAVSASAKAGSVDQGAALCVLAYRHRDQLGSSAGLQESGVLLAKIDAFLSATQHAADPHRERWRISLLYVKGLILATSGCTQEARRAWQQCVEVAECPQIPLLATKTIDACRRLGLSYAAMGEEQQAKRWFLQGVVKTREILASGDWRNMIGDPKAPLIFGFDEVIQTLRIAKQCAQSYLDYVHPQAAGPVFGLGYLKNTPLHPEVRELLQGIADLEGLLQERDSALTKQAATIGQMRASFDQQEVNIAELRGLQQPRESALAEQDNTIRQMRASFDQQEVNVAELRSLLQARESALAEQGNTIQQMRASSAEQEASVAELRSRLHARESALAEQGDTIRQMRAGSDEQEASIAELRSLLHARESALAEQGNTIQQMRASSAEQEASIAELRSLLRARESVLAKQDDTIRQMRAGSDEQEASIAELRGLLQARESALAEQGDTIRQMRAGFDQQEVNIEELRRMLDSANREISALGNSRVLRLVRLIKSGPRTLGAAKQIIYLLGAIFIPNRFKPAIRSLWRIGRRRALPEAPSVRPALQPYEVKVPKPRRAERPRILHAIANFMIGGSSRLIVDLIEHLGADYEQTVITSFIPDPHGYVNLPIRELRHLAGPEDVLTFLANCKPDLLHVHYWGDCDEPWYRQVFRAGEIFGCPIIQNINTPVSPFQSDGIVKNICVSSYVQREFAPEVHNAEVVYPGSNFSLFKRRSFTGIPDDCVGMVYRLEPDKLNEQSIDPLVKAVQRRPNTRCLVVGGGTLLPKFQQAVQLAGVANSFEFTHYVSYERLPQEYKRMSIFVAPVWKESFGQVSPFAMSMGIPIVGYAVGALPEIVGDPGLLAPAGDSDQLAYIIATLLDDRARRLAIGKRNAARARSLYSMEAMIDHYARIYADILGAPK